MGRRQKDIKADHLIQIRITKSDKELLLKTAGDLGLDISKFIRMVTKDYIDNYYK